MKMRRVVSAVVTAVLASIGVVVVTGTPAWAISDCRTPYTSGSWNATPCIERRIVNGAYQYRAAGNMTTFPSNCSTYRAYITEPDGTNYWSTGAWSCTHPYIETVWASFLGGTATGAKARLVAYNSSGAQILNLLSPAVY